jgi:hypothetical protein
VLTELEYRVVRKYCDLEGRAVPSREEISLVRRDRNSVGFMTEIRIGGGVDLQWSSRVYDRLPSARVGAAGELVGFLMFFDPDRTISIEGFVYGETWPESEHPIEFA